MKQNELASLLDLSTASISKLVARGMPTDTVGAASAWRRQNLQPSMIKGGRFDSTRATTRPPVQPARPPEAMTYYLADADIEAAGDALDGALRRGDKDRVAALSLKLRELLPDAAPGASPRLSVRVWLALLDYLLCPQAAIRTAPDMAAILSPEEVGTKFFPTEWPWSAGLVLFECADHDGYATRGWPKGWDE